MKLFLHLALTLTSDVNLIIVSVLHQSILQYSPFTDHLMFTKGCSYNKEKRGQWDNGRVTSESGNTTDAHKREKIERILQSNDDISRFVHRLKAFSD